MGKPMFAPIPGTVFWPYFAGAAIFLIGLLASWKELALARAEKKILVLARLSFAAPIALFASQHFTETPLVSRIVPSWIPAHVFWTYFVGASLIAAALSIAVKKFSQIAAVLLGATLIMFVLLIHIPNIIAHPRSVFTWAIAFRDLAFSGGALALAGAPSRQGRPVGKSTLITFARIFVAVPVIYFGVAHFRHPESLPADDFDQRTPTWIPGHALWPYLAGAVLIVAGVTMLLNWKPRLAATCLGVTVLLLLLFVFLPLVVSRPFDIDNGLNYFASTLAFGAVAFLLAAAFPEHDPINEDDKRDAGAR